MKWFVFGLALVFVGCEGPAPAPETAQCRITATTTVGLQMPVRIEVYQNGVMVGWAPITAFATMMDENGNPTAWDLEATYEFTTGQNYVINAVWDTDAVLGNGPEEIMYQTEEFTFKGMDQYPLGDISDEM